MVYDSTLKQRKELYKLRYERAVEILDNLKEKETQLRLLALVESLGIDIPKENIDLSQLLRDKGYNELAEQIDKEIMNN